MRRIYKSVIHLRRELSPMRLREMAAIAARAFDNRAGKVKNSSHNPYVLIFKGGEAEWACLDLGTLDLEDIPGFLDDVRAFKWIDADPRESGDMLEVFATRFDKRI